MTRGHASSLVPETSLPTWLTKYTKKINLSLKMIQKESAMIHEQISTPGDVTEVQSQVSFHLDVIDDYSNILKSHHSSLLTHLSSTFSQITSLKNRIRSLIEQQNDYDTILNALFDMEILSAELVAGEDEFHSQKHSNIVDSHLGHEAQPVGSAIASEETTHAESEDDLHFEKRQSRKRKQMMQLTSNVSQTHQSNVLRQKSGRSTLRRFRDEYLRLREEYDIMKTLPEKILKWNSRKEVNFDSPSDMENHSMTGMFSSTDARSKLPDQHWIHAPSSKRTHLQPIAPQRSHSEDKHHSTQRHSSLRHDYHSSSSDSLGKLHDTDRMQLKKVIQNVSSSVVGNNFHNITHLSESPLEANLTKRLMPNTWKEERKDTWEEELDKHHERYIQEKKKLEENAAALKLGPLVAASVRQESEEHTSAPKLVPQKQMPFPIDVSTQQKKPYRPFVKTFQQSKSGLLGKMSNSIMGNRQKKQRGAAKKYTLASSNAKKELQSDVSDGDPTDQNPNSARLSAWADATTELDPAAIYSQSTLRTYMFPNNKSPLIHKPPSVEDPLKNLKDIRRSSSPQKQVTPLSSDSTRISFAKGPRNEPSPNAAENTAPKSTSAHTSISTPHLSDPYAIMDSSDMSVITTLPEIPGNPPARGVWSRQQQDAERRNFIVESPPKSRNGKKEHVQRLPVLQSVQTLSLDFATY